MAGGPAGRPAGTVSGTAPRALVLAGGGCRSDRWHDLAGTGHAAAEVLRTVGVESRLTSRIRDVVAGGRFDADLLVVNCSDGPWVEEIDGTPADWRPFGDALATHLERGRPVLALHSSALAFPDVELWRRTVGAWWQDGITMHPDLGPARVEVDPAHPASGGLRHVDVVDERYSWLVRADGVEIAPYVTHEHGGEVHPLAWSREVGDARLVYDALGHDLRSYDSPSRRTLLAAEARWLLDG